VRLGCRGNLKLLGIKQIDLFIKALLGKWKWRLWSLRQDCENMSLFLNMDHGGN